MSNQENIQLTSDDMRKAMSEAIREVLADKQAITAFWSAAFEQVQEHATVQTGRWVIDGVRTIISKVSLVIAAGLLIYSLGGWSALMRFWHVTGTTQ